MVLHLSIHIVPDMLLHPIIHCRFPHLGIHLVLFHSRPSSFRVVSGTSTLGTFNIEFTDPRVIRGDLITAWVLNHNAPKEMDEKSNIRGSYFIEVD